MGNVIAMESVSKTALTGALAEMDLAAFSKALAVVKRLDGCSASERVRTLNNWLDAGIITAPECKATLDYYGYRMGK